MAITIESGSPKGSFYRNFPGSKEEFGTEALSLAGERLAAGMRQLAAAASPLAFLRSLTAALAVGLEASDHANGPIATVALETATTSDALREVARVQFAAWEPRSPLAWPATRHRPAAIVSSPPRS